MLFRNAAGTLFADTKAVGDSQYAIPGATLVHLGFGEFSLEVPGLGSVEYVRGGEAFEGCSGRSHTVCGDAPAIAALVAALTVKEAA